MKQRLTKIVYEAMKSDIDQYGVVAADTLSGSLIEAGVILPKFKIGQEVWFFDCDLQPMEMEIMHGKVSCITFREIEPLIEIYVSRVHNEHEIYFGRTFNVYANKEEASIAFNELNKECE